MTFVIIEACGTDWYYTNLGPSRYTFQHGVFHDSLSGDTWPCDLSFHRYLEKLNP